MQISLNHNQLIIDLGDEDGQKIRRIHEHWPHLIEEYMNMIIKNRERQLERIEVTHELRSRAIERSKKSENK